MRFVGDQGHQSGREAPLIERTSGGMRSAVCSEPERAAVGSALSAKERCEGMPPTTENSQPELDVALERGHADADDRPVQVAVLAGLVAYLVAVEAAFGLRVEHVLGALPCAALALRGGRALRFFVLFLPIVLTGITYDFFRLVTGLRGAIHVADLYTAELAMFGIGSGSARQVPAAFLLEHTHVVLDVVSGVAYIVYLYVPMVVAALLYFRDRERMLGVSLAFFFTNLIGLFVYLAYPAAPPWYVFDHGLGPVVIDAAPSAAGAARFDAWLGVDYFRSFYARSANVFGAMPSLHVAYPTSTLFAAAAMGRRWWLPLGAFVLVVSFAAIYLQHHYVLDLLAGVSCAALGYGAAELVLRRMLRGARRA